MSREVERIGVQLDRALRGKAWHGPSMTELLSDVDETKAGWRPIPGVHTIGELVMHVIAWQEEASRRLGGEARDLPAEEDWPQPLPWLEMLDRLNQSHRALLSRVLELDDLDLEKGIKGQPGSVYDLLHGIVQHNLYHAGQIALLKKGLAWGG
ncbi:MAG TPA: DinB family protein [Vicinamibacteria bacterium]|nr:DinB family protein [Vicinamibacteria bacterium]